MAALTRKPHAPDPDTGTVRDLFVDSAAELLAVLLYGLASLGLAVGGALAETAGFRDLLGGEPMVGAWLAFVGLVALVAGAHLARDKVLPRAAALQ